MKRIFEELKTCLDVYWQATGIGLLLLDESGAAVGYFGNPNDYCDLIHQNQNQFLRCIKVHKMLGPERMYYLGELLYHLVSHLLSGEDLQIIHRRRDRRPFMQQPARRITPDCSIRISKQ